MKISLKRKEAADILREQLGTDIRLTISIGADLIDIDETNRQLTAEEKTALINALKTINPDAKEVE